MRSTSALDVDAVAGHLDLEPADPTVCARNPAGHTETVEGLFGVWSRDLVAEQRRRAGRTHRHPAARRRCAVFGDATRHRPPAHAAMSCAPLAAPASRASGSVPRSKRCDASVCRSSRRAVRRMPVRVNDADSSSTSTVSLATSDVAPPITPAIATGRSTSQINRSPSVMTRSTPSRVCRGSPSAARRTTMPGPSSRCRSNACRGCPSSSIA